MRLILQSPYLTLEYLLWRKFNLKDFSNTSPKQFRVMSTAQDNRNLVVCVYTDNVLHFRLKQYGSLGQGSYIENEYRSITFLKSQKIDFIPNIYFYDEDNRIVATENLIGYSNAIEYINGISEDKLIFDFILKVSGIFKQIHKCDVTRGQHLKKYNPTQIIAIDFTIQSLDYYKDLAFLYEKWDSTALIHFDLNLYNILVSVNDIKIIDWELAMIGDPIWDIAIFIEKFCKFKGDSSFFLDENPARFDTVKGIIRKLLHEYPVNKKKLKVYLRLITKQYNEHNKRTIESLIGS